MANTEISRVGGARLSSIEALRLLCMLLVLNLHSFWGYDHGTGFWQAIDFLRESASICAVDCFVLISGYFGIKWKFKSLFNLIFQILFYSIGIYIIVVALGLIDWNTKDFLERFECLFAASKSWGFAVSYLLLYFLAPALNALADKLDNRELLVSIIILFIAINFICLPDIVFTYALVYLIGRFLRKTNIAESKIPAVGGYFIITLIIFIIVYFGFFGFLGIKDANTLNSLPIGLFAYAYSAPLVILQAVMLFICFAKMNFCSKIINWCASSCFAIFLIHMHPTIKEMGYYAFTRSLYELPVYKHILILTVLIIIVFCGSILIDKIRILFSDIIYFLIKKMIGLFPIRWHNALCGFTKGVIS